MTHRNLAACAIAVVLCGGGGCAGRPGVEGVTGTLVYRVEGAPLVMCDLKTMHKQVVLPAQRATRGLGGVSKVSENTVVISQVDSGGVPEVVLVGIPSGRLKRLGEGSFPTATTSGAYVVWYEETDGRADSVALVRRRADGVGPVDTLAHVRNLGEKGWSWWVRCVAPVALDSGWVAFAGVDGSVWRVDATSGVKVRMGGKGLVPKYWRGYGFNIVCRMGVKGGAFVVLDDDGGIQPVKALRWCSGYAQRPGEPRAILVLPGRPRLSHLIADSWRWVVYDWRTGRTRVLLDDGFFAGSAAWLKEELVHP